MANAETDFENPQDDSIVEGQVDGLAGGIMDLLEDASPDHSEKATSREATEEEKAPVKEEPEEEIPDEAATSEPEKYTIKWQGQEKEVTQEELVNLAQQGFDYTQKTQALSQERDNLAPFVGLAKQIQSDPIKAAQIAAILSGTPQQQAPQKKQFDDPIEQLKWETKQEALAEIRAEMQQQMIPMQRMQVLNQVKAEAQRDPDYAEVHQKIVDMVASQPPALQKTLYLQLDQDPASYMEAFQFYKQQKATAIKTDTTETKIVKKETKAPILDAGGVASGEQTTSSEKAKRISKQKAAALRSGDPMAIGDWLKDSGALDHIY
jgi:hypothetical protein